MEAGAFGGKSSQTTTQRTPPHFFVSLAPKQRGQMAGGSAFQNESCKVTSKYVWPNMNADIRQWTHACLACQWSKVHVHPMSPIGRFRPLDSRFANVHVYLVGPLPTVNGHTHRLTCIDRFTCWPEAILLTSTTTGMAARPFLKNWVTCFDVPSDLTSDRGAQFESSLWQP